MSQRDHTDPVGDFLKMSVRDQAAVARHLSQDEQRRLLSLRTIRVARPRAAVGAAGEPDWSAYSPWLAKHLVRIMDDKAASKLTPAARAALDACLVRPRTGARP